MTWNKLIINTLLIGTAVLGFNCADKNAENQSQEKPEIAENPEHLYEGLAFEMNKVQLPSFPAYVVSITDFGAINDGLTDNSESFKAAIEDVSEKGGGKVVVPRGIWKTGPIVLKSNINLNVERGALVVFDDDLDKYPLIATSFEGLDTYRCQSPISGKNLENIAITGEGVIDGSGGAWRMVKKSKLAPPHWNRLVKSGGVLSEDKQVWYPTEMTKLGDINGNFNVPDFKTIEQYETIKNFLRPVMVSLVECKKVLLDGPTFQNSPAWNLHPLMCEDITLRNLMIRNPWFSQNGDGLDLESCKNAIVYNCRFDVGDDAICFKSGKNEDGIKRAIPTENVIVKDNVVYHGHGGFVIGSEMSGGVKNVHVSRCTFIGTDCGLRFKSTRGRGGVVENIYISDIDMIDIPTEAIRFNLYYGGSSPIPEEGQADLNSEKREIVPVSITTPSFRNIYLKNITSVGSDAAAFFQGLPEMKLSNIQLENVTLEANKGITLIDASDIVMTNVKILQENGAAITVFNTKGLNIDGFSANAALSPTFKVYGAETEKVTIKNAGFTMEDFSLGAKVETKSVMIE